MRRLQEFDEAISAMSVQSSPLSKDYIFYMYIVSNCRVHFEPTLPAAAAVNFQYDHFNLFINPLDVIAEVEDPKTGEVKKILGFKSLPLEQRVGVIKHECEHIVLNHLSNHKRVVEEYHSHHDLVNSAMDCALNQSIDPEHLPDYVLYPKNFSRVFNLPKQAPDNLTWEQYYDLIPQEEKDKCQKEKEEQQKLLKEIIEKLIEQAKNGESSPAKVKGKLPKGHTLDDHSKWSESQGDTEIARDLAKKIVDSAINETQKSRGNLPHNISVILNALSPSKEVPWQKVFRNVSGNRRVGVRHTLLRPDRRQPHHEWIKGKTKDRKFNWLLVVDVSGSMSDRALKTTLSETINLCKVTNTDAYMIQIDTQAHKPEKITSKTKFIERKASGGTYLSPALEKAAEHKIEYDAVVVVTDGYVSSDDIQPFYNLNKPVLWLIESDGEIPSVEQGKMKAFKLKK
jgi:predicted metal-dependent peptidase